MKTLVVGYKPLGNEFLVKNSGDKLAPAQYEADAKQALKLFEEEFGVSASIMRNNHDSDECILAIVKGDAKLREAEYVSLEEARGRVSEDLKHCLDSLDLVTKKRLEKHNYFN